MSNDDETFLIHSDNLTTVLSAFFKAFKGNPLMYVSMDEAVTLFGSLFGIEDDHYQICESDLKAFLNAINGISVGRMMVDMDKKGLATLAHDGEQLFLIGKKD